MLSTTAASASTLTITASVQPEPNDNFACHANNTSFFTGLEISVTHPLKGTTNLSPGALQGLLYDNRNSSATTDATETFVTESFRLPSASYTSQTNVTDVLGTYPSSQSLDTGGEGGAKAGLLIIPTENGATNDTRNTSNGSLVYPTRGIDNYGAINFYPRGTSANPIINPNYTSLSNNTGDRFYISPFKNGCNVLFCTL